MKFGVVFDIVTLLYETIDRLFPVYPNILFMLKITNV